MPLDFDSNCPMNGVVAVDDADWNRRLSRNRVVADAVVHRRSLANVNAIANEIDDVSISICPKVDVENDAPDRNPSPPDPTDDDGVEIDSSTNIDAIFSRSTPI